jgi:vitamin K-dependent gamma-carboxylase-like protein
VRRLERWLFPRGTPTALAAVRIGLCTILAGRLAFGSYAELADAPAALFRPRSFMHLLHAMPPRPAVLGLQIVGVAAATLAAVGFRARLALPLAWISALFLNGIATSVGKIVHNDVVLLLALVPLLAAPISDAWSLDALRGKTFKRSMPGGSIRYGWPVRTAMVVVAGAYFFAGLAKLVNSGPAWVTSENMRWILYSAGHSEFAVFIADRPWLAHLVAAATLTLELGFVLVLWRRELAWLFVPGAVTFHLGIWLAMGLDYSAQAATAVVVFTNWPWLVERLRTREPREYPSSGAVGHPL